MDSRVEKILEIWHKHFSDENNQYSGFEDSDIEYFVSSLLYNHFAFSKALETMKRIDLSYDFISACADEYDEILAIIKTIEIDDEAKKIEFLQDFLQEAKNRYSEDECYLLNRMSYHVDGIEQRFNDDEKIQKVEFSKPQKRSANPLLR
jgi:hypothetical protein